MSDDPLPPRAVSRGALEWLMGLAAAAGILTFFGLNCTPDRDTNEVASPQESVVPSSPSITAYPSPSLSLEHPATSPTSTDVSAPLDSADPVLEQREYLVDQEQIDGYWRTDIGYLGGTVYPQSLVQQAGCNEKATVVYHLGGDFKRFEAVAGISDKSSDEVQLRFEVAVDGVVKARWDAQLGRPRRLSIAVHDKLQLRLTGYYLNRRGCGPNAWWVFGDPTLVR